MVYLPTNGHPSKYTNSGARGRESNSQPVDHKSDALTTTLPSQDLIKYFDCLTQGIIRSIFQTHCTLERACMLIKARCNHSDHDVMWPVVAETDARDES